MAITMDQIKKLREETGAGVMDAKSNLVFRIQLGKLVCKDFVPNLWNGAVDIIKVWVVFETDGTGDSFGIVAFVGLVGIWNVFIAGIKVNFFFWGLLATFLKVVWF